MSDLKKKLDHTKEKIAGGAKEVAGKITNNEQLELKGKLQGAKSDLKKNMSISDKAKDIKESVAGKINDVLDKKKAKK